MFSNLGNWEGTLAFLATVEGYLPRIWLELELELLEEGCCQQERRVALEPDGLWTGFG